MTAFEDGGEHTSTNGIMPGAAAAEYRPRPGRLQGKNAIITGAAGFVFPSSSVVPCAAAEVPCRSAI
jgi:hypothetical protein